MLDNAPIGLGFLDRVLRVRHLNRVLAAMSNRALGADVGRELWEVLPDLREPLEEKLRTVAPVRSAHRKHADQVVVILRLLMPARSTALICTKTS